MIFTQKNFWQIQSQIRYPISKSVQPFCLKPKIYSGKQIFSLLLPGDLNVEEKNFEIIDGKLVRGQLRKGEINRMLSIVAHEYSQERAAEMISDLQRVAIRFLTMRGFSTGLADFKLRTNEMKQLVEKEAKQGKCHSIMQRVGKKALNYLQNNGEENGLLSMVECKSKGSLLNIVSISAFLGQQIVDGQTQIPLYKRKTLPGFGFNPSSPSSRGFISNSYQDGLTNTQLFFHLMAGREGLTDTACKTASCGYIERKIMRVQENLIVRNRCEVWDSGNLLVEFHYGGDGCDASKLVRFSLNEIFELDVTNERPRLLEAFPFVENLIQQVKENLHIFGSSSSIETPIHARNRELSQDLIHKPSKHLKKTLAFIRKELGKYNPSILILLFYFLNASKQELGKVKRQILAAKIALGENVGCISGSSLGMPITQLTLDSFHSSGQAHGSVQGLARFKELIDCAKQLKMYTCNIRIQENLHSAIPYYKNHIIKKTMGDYVKHFEIVENHFSLENSSLDFQIFHSFMLPETRSHLLKYGALPHVVKLFLNPVLPYEKKLLIKRMQQILDESVLVYFNEDCIEIRLTNYKLVTRTIQNDEQLMIQASLFAYETFVSQLLSTKAHGIDGVEAVIGGSVKNSISFQCDPLKNVLEEFAHTLTGFDIYQSASNNPRDIMELFGIEAARVSLYKELSQVLEESFISPRHIMLLVNQMTRSGTLVPISRHGMSKNDVSTLQRCCFEETSETFNRASIKGKTDDCTGVSSCILTGKDIQCGTGFFQAYDLSSSSSYSVEEIYKHLKYVGVDKPMRKTSSNVGKRNRQGRTHTKAIWCYLENPREVYARLCKSKRKIEYRKPLLFFRDNQ